MQSSSAGKDIFDESCASCHSIGDGIIVGPDLQGVLDRRDRAWVAEFISIPDQLILSGDPIVLELLAEYNDIEMPNLALTETEVESLLIFFESGESVEAVDITLPQGHVARGEAIFTGTQALEMGGTPCIACHTVGTVGAFGGGNLGPDLTKVYSRFGKIGLTSSLQNIAFPTMRGVYEEKSLTNQEVSDLLVFLTINSARGEEEGVADSASALFWGVGLMGAALLFGFMSFFWSQQKETLSDRLRKDAGITSRRHS
ncbi:MAG: c-type cytochrome [Anaerolineae bacterium]|nr:c-type cytochrome [Anaerolineae bacterium]MBT7783450.1 c-type cytochrome [Anaerolineae bacterium]